jgi:hypothetical protein
MRQGLLITHRNALYITLFSPKHTLQTTLGVLLVGKNALRPLALTVRARKHFETSNKDIGGKSRLLPQFTFLSLVRTDYRHDV